MSVRGNRTLFTFLSVLVLLVVAVAGQAPAQDEKSAVENNSVGALDEFSPEELGRRGADLMATLRDAVVAARTYQARISGSSAEDSLVLRLQVIEAQDRFMSTLKDLSRVAEAADDGETGQTLRRRVGEVHVEVTPRLWEIIGELRAEIDAHRTRRQLVEASARSALEDNLRMLNARLDRIFLYGADHIQDLEKFGYDTAADTQLFSDLLKERANELDGRIALASLRVKELESRRRESPDDADLGALVVAARKSLESNATSQGVVLNIMDRMGLDTERYRTRLVTSTQDLASGLRDVNVAKTLLRRGWDRLVGWLKAEGPGFLLKFVLFLVIMALGRFVARVTGSAVEKSMDRARVNMSHLLKRMIVNATRNAITAVALVFGLAQFGFSLGPLLAGFGVVGFILGFAMQDSLSNLAAGMMILINRPYDVGDLVEISGVFGRVEEMSMVSTGVLTLDNQKLVVPNSKIWGDVIKNVTDQKVRRIDMTFGISYTDDIPHAEEVLNAILAEHDKVLDDPEPMVRVHTLNDSSVDFVVRPWVRTEEYWNVYWDVTRAVKMRFDAEDISIPFPQRDVHIYEQKKLPTSEGGSETVQGPVAETGQTEPDAG